MLKVLSQTILMFYNTVPFKPQNILEPNLNHTSLIASLTLFSDNPLTLCYPSVENPDHCDFISLRNLLIRTHMQDLKDVTNNVLYENYRSAIIGGENPLGPVTLNYIQFN